MKRVGLWSLFINSRLRYNGLTSSAMQNKWKVENFITSKIVTVSTEYSNQTNVPKQSIFGYKIKPVIYGLWWAKKTESGKLI